MNPNLIPILSGIVQQKGATLSAPEQHAIARMFRQLTSEDASAIMSQIGYNPTQTFDEYPGLNALFGGLSNLTDPNAKKEDIMSTLTGALSPLDVAPLESGVADDWLTQYNAIPVRELGSRFPSAETRRIVDMFKKQSRANGRFQGKAMDEAEQNLLKRFAPPTPAPVAETSTPALEAVPIAPQADANEQLMSELRNNPAPLSRAYASAGLSSTPTPAYSLGAGTQNAALQELSLDEVSSALPNFNLTDAQKPEFSPSQSPYVFGASAESRAPAIAQRTADADPVAAKNASRLQKYERRHPATGLTGDSLVKPQAAPHTPRTLFGIAPSTASQVQAPTPALSVEAALQELENTAPVATAPVTPTPVAATPTPQLVQELSTPTPTPTPVLDPKPVSELADGIPGASALGGTVSGATPTAGAAPTADAAPKRTITFGKLPKVGAPDAPAKGLKGLHKSLSNASAPNTLNGLNASKTASIGKAGAKGGIGDFFAKFRKSNTLANPAGTPGKSGAGLGFTKGKGLSLGGSNALATLGTAAAIGGGVVNGLSNLKAASDEDRRTDDLSSDIIIAAASNPMATYGLTPDQLKTLGDVRSGRIDKSVDLGDIDWGSALSGGLTGALTGAAGGIPGAIAGGIAGLAGGGLGGFSQSKARKNAELDALYQALNQSNTNYQNAMRNRLFERYF
jgi:hypothetical protein